MCTALAFHTKNHYFGRNLDLEYSYHETVTVTPRNYEFKFRQLPSLPSHYAMVGMAFVQDNYPLYYDAINEKGLGMAGTSFWDNAVYHQLAEGQANVAPFEIIPYVLAQCATIEEARQLLTGVNLAAINFSEQLPASALHWLISDGERSLVVESVADGLHVYDNPTGVLTNNPPFSQQLFSLNNYRSLSPYQPENQFAAGLELPLYSRGMGTLGLPGDMTSTSRFVKAVFTKMHSRCGDSETESVSQFLHILGGVCQQKGMTHIEDDKFEYTIYSSCGNLETGVYYYTTYDNSEVHGVDMHRENLDGAELTTYELVTEPEFKIQN